MLSVLMLTIFIYRKPLGWFEGRRMNDLLKTHYRKMTKKELIEELEYLYEVYLNEMLDLEAEE